MGRRRKVLSVRRRAFSPRHRGAINYSPSGLPETLRSKVNHRKSEEGGLDGAIKETKFNLPAPEITLALAQKKEKNRAVRKHANVMLGRKNGRASSPTGLLMRRDSRRYQSASIKRHITAR